jgi:hypothetical protein
MWFPISSICASNTVMTDLHGCVVFGLSNGCRREEGGRTASVSEWGFPELGLVVTLSFYRILLQKSNDQPGRSESDRSC